MPLHVHPEVLHRFIEHAASRFEEQGPFPPPYVDFKTRGMHELAMPLFGRTYIPDRDHPFFTFELEDNEEPGGYRIARKALPGYPTGCYDDPPELVKLDIRKFDESWVYLTIDLDDGRFVVEYVTGTLRNK
ncbi:MAG: hypothetical protein Q9168_007112 [Polycauliona sp. 1 TL-2023]